MSQNAATDPENVSVEIGMPHITDEMLDLVPEELLVQLKTLGCIAHKLQLASVAEMLKSAQGMAEEVKKETSQTSTGNRGVKIEDTPFPTTADQITTTLKNVQAKEAKIEEGLDREDKDIMSLAEKHNQIYLEIYLKLQKIEYEMVKALLAVQIPPKTPASSSAFVNDLANQARELPLRSRQMDPMLLRYLQVLGKPEPSGNAATGNESGSHEGGSAGSHALA